MFKHLSSIALFTLLLSHQAQAANTEQPASPTSSVSEYFHNGTMHYYYDPTTAAVQTTQACMSPLNQSSAFNPFMILAANANNASEQDLLTEVKSAHFKAFDHGRIAEQDMQGITPLHLAIEKGYEKLAAYLFEQLIQENKILVLTTQDIYGNTPIHLAIHKNFVSLATNFFRSLKKIDQGYVLRLKDARARTIVHLVFKKLHRALETNQTQIFQEKLLSLAVIIVPLADTADFIVMEDESGNRHGSSARTYYNNVLAPLLVGCPVGSKLKQQADLLADQMYMPTIHDRVDNDVATVTQTLNTVTINATKTPVSPSSISSVTSKTPSTSSSTNNSITVKENKITRLSYSAIVQKKPIVQTPQPVNNNNVMPSVSVPKKSDAQKQVSSVTTVAVSSSNKTDTNSKQPVVDKDGFESPKKTFKASAKTMANTTTTASDQTAKTEGKAAVITTVPTVTEVTNAATQPIIPALSPLEELFAEIATNKKDKGLARLQAAITKLGQPKKGSWHNTAGKTPLYVAFETNALDKAELVAQAFPRLIELPNKDKERTSPMTYILMNAAQNSKLSSFLTNWDIAGFIDLDVPDAVTGETLRSALQESGILPVATQAQKEEPKKKNKTIQQVRDENATRLKKAGITQQVNNLSSEELSAFLLQAIATNPPSFFEKPEIDASLKILPFLVSIKTNPNAPLQQVSLCSRPYYGALLHAIQAKSLENTAHFLNKIIDPNVILVPTGETILTYVMQQLCADSVDPDFIYNIMMVLCSSDNIDINKPNLNGMTLLHVAAKAFPMPNFLQMLLDKGANPVSTATKANFTPVAFALHLASHREDLTTALEGIHVLATASTEATMDAVGRFCEQQNTNPVVKAYLDKYPATLSSWAKANEPILMQVITSYVAYHILDKLCETDPELVARNLLLPFKVTITPLDNGVSLHRKFNALQSALVTIENATGSEACLTSCKQLARKLLTLAPAKEWLVLDEAIHYKDLILYDPIIDYKSIVQQHLVDKEGKVIELATSLD